MQRLQTTIRERIAGLFVRRGLPERADGEAMCHCEHGGGFSLDAGVRIEANDRQGLDHLAAPIPPPRRHRHRKYGVPAPNSPLRPAVTAMAAAPEPVSPRADAVAEKSSVSRATRYPWAMLLARIYEVFPLTCPQCGGTMQIIAFIDDPVEVKKILTHLGEATVPPELAQARGPPLWEAAQHGSADPFAKPMPAFEFNQRIAWWQRSSSTPTGEPLAGKDGWLGAPPEEDIPKFLVHDGQSERKQSSNGGCISYPLTGYYAGRVVAAMRTGYSIVMLR